MIRTSPDRLATAPHEPVRFVLGWTPPSLNTSLRSHWSARRKTRLTAACLILEAIGRRGADPERSRVRVTVQMYRRNRMDQDGAVGSLKPVFDGLVRLGWARDDSPVWMEQVVRPVILDRRGPPRTEIVIERLPQKKGEGAVPSRRKPRRNGEGGQL